LHNNGVLYDNKFFYDTQDILISYLKCSLRIGTALLNNAHVYKRTMRFDCSPWQTFLDLKAHCLMVLLLVANGETHSKANVYYLCYFALHPYLAWMRLLLLPPLSFSLSFFCLSASFPLSLYLSLSLSVYMPLSLSFSLSITASFSVYISLSFYQGRRSRHLVYCSTYSTYFSRWSGHSNLLFKTF
jgi:hypothetical protein